MKIRLTSLVALVALSLTLPLTGHSKEFSSRQQRFE